MSTTIAPTLYTATCPRCDWQSPRSTPDPLAALAWADAHIAAHREITPHDFVPHGSIGAECATCGSEPEAHVDQPATTATALCGRTDAHGPHWWTAKGRPCVGNVGPFLTAQP